MRRNFLVVAVVLMFGAAASLAAQAKHVVVTEDVEDTIVVSHQGPQSSTAAESIGAVVDVAAGNAEVEVADSVVGSAVSRTFTDQFGRT